MSRETQGWSRLAVASVMAIVMTAVATPSSAQTALYSTRSETAWDGFGARLESIGDINGDGVLELAVSCVGSGEVRVLSGADGRELYSLRGGAGFGLALAHGEFDGDGFQDLAVGAPLHRDANDGHEAGAVFLYSGRDGSLIFVTEGGAGDQHLGSKLFTLGDLDGGGLDDLLIGGAEAGAQVLRTESRTSLSSGAQGGPQADSTGVWNALLGSREAPQSVACLLGDLDGDGKLDWGLASSPLAGKTRSVKVTMSGASNSELSLVSGVTGDGFGWSLAGLADVDGDGVGDIAVGAPADDTLAPDGGAVYVFSGRTGAELTAIHGTTKGGRLGGAVAGLGDVNQDGVTDLCATGQEGAYGVLRVFALWPDESASPTHPIHTGADLGGQ